MGYAIYDTRENFWITKERTFKKTATKDLKYIKKTIPKKEWKHLKVKRK